VGRRALNPKSLWSSRYVGNTGSRRSWDVCSVIGAMDSANGRHRTAVTTENEWTTRAET
jgi:hypothetical protein